MKNFKTLILIIFAFISSVNYSTSCNTSQSCGGNFGTVSCSGSSSCSASNSDLSVTCDGVTTSCPSPIQRPDEPTLEDGWPPLWGE